jgi:hypothetical protein
MLNIIQGVFFNLIIDKRGIEEKEGNVKISGLKFIPFDDCSTNVIATYQKIRFREFSKGTLAGEVRSNICEGIRAEIMRVTFVLGSLTERD